MDVNEGAGPPASSTHGPDRGAHSGDRRIEGLRPARFGPEEAQMFGCYHPPDSTGDSGRSSVAVLCHPLGEEYLRSHRAFLQLAVRLSRAGTPALRFDYRGTGDSSGESHRFGLRDWQADVVRAARFARECAGRSSVTLIGLRMGATLALLAAREMDSVAGLVLWDPVLDGRRHTESLRAAHREMLRMEYVSDRRGGVPVDTQEALGFALPEQLSREISALDLASELEAASAPALVIVSSDPSESVEDDDLLHVPKGVEVVAIDGASVWKEEANRRLVPSEALNRIVRWMEGGRDD